MADSVTGGATAKSPDIPALYPKHGGKPRLIGPVERFGLSALAPAVAVIFTNPFDTVKVRLQLQGEKARRINTSMATGTMTAQAETIVYKNSFDAVIKIFSNEGMAGLQKGLYPAILKEGSKNVFRIGMYDPIMSIVHDPSKGSAPGWKRMLAGSICGLLGAFSCNPFELVKTRLQSSAAGKIAVGTQYKYNGVWDALVQTVRQDGFKGLYRGSMLSMSRSIVGSGTNLASYSMMKEYLMLKKNWKDNWVLDMTCGLGSGIVSCVFMNPIDVVRTRYYNQPYENGRGMLYKSGTDAISRPHFCLTFVFLGVFRRQLSTVYYNLDLRDSFQSFDLDKDGRIDRKELSMALRKIISPPTNTADMKAYNEMIDLWTSRILSKADFDNDSAISFSEYEKASSELKQIFIETHSALRALAPKLLT
ncbi:hypothetical protein HDV05_000068 [Chytridiales sp. JEL 0842]|nr:hypothetical protein HDV05_000068 [Chytridiales sp. JEL 0842]